MQFSGKDSTARRDLKAQRFTGTRGSYTLFGSPARRGNVQLAGKDSTARTDL
ncbi:MAG: hypothetical protein PHV51_01120 [Methanosarcinaceae archaeon]|nr:hypothetical protein [Methanosarcinaceae archaeon]